MPLRNSACHRIALCSVLLFISACGTATGQEAAWPVRTVQIVVPYTPGTGADILSRTLGPMLSERWKVSVITDNRPGATGNIGTEHVAKSPADGYTLLCTATSFGTNPALHRKLPFDPVKGFEPVALLATSAVSLVVNPRLSATSVGEFIELAKKRPGQLDYASPGSGGPQHLAMELFKQEAHIDLVHVPYKGAGGAMADIVAGHVQAGIMALQTAAPYVESGKLRMLAVMSAERSPVFPSVPTMKELGMGELVVETWYGVFAPAGTPRPIVVKINADLDALLKQPDVRVLLAKQGMSAGGGTPERFGELVSTELARWSRVVKAAGIKAD